jgi:hypothetical protein
VYSTQKWTAQATSLSFSFDLIDHKNGQAGLLPVYFIEHNSGRLGLVSVDLIDHKNGQSRPSF